MDVDAAPRFARAEGATSEAHYAGSRVAPAGHRFPDAPRRAAERGGCSVSSGGGCGVPSSLEAGFLSRETD